MDERIAVVGLGYVGLPVAVAFGRKHTGVIGFDLDAARIDALRAGDDRTGQVAADDLSGTRVRFTSDPADLEGATFYVLAVPTALDDSRRPDLQRLVNACAIVGERMKRGAAVVIESTVYPGATEEICAPALERASGLRREEFSLGYAPERLNPGDRQHTFERVVKVVAADSEAALARIAGVYESVVAAGVHRAPSIRVAETAKLIDLTQRDVNIALMNEVALIFDRMGIRTHDVLEAAGTKWNFLRFSPGLVGGHRIGVDPQFLAYRAEELGYHPDVILSGRAVNDGMGRFIAQRLVKLLIRSDIQPGRATRVGILGFTFKEDVADVRHTRVADIVRELGEFGIQAKVHDPLADAAETEELHQVRLSPWDELSALDALVLAVPHSAYRQLGTDAIVALVKPGGVVMDVRSILDPARLPAGMQYWSL